MLRGGDLSGSFSGSLNFGGEASSKVLDICKSCIKKHRAKMIEVVAANRYEELRAFCKDKVSKKCKKIKFPEDLAKQIKDLGETGVTDDGEQEDEEEGIQLVEDDDDVDKQDL